ncbi:MAG: hypothetical protein QME58_09515 [Bacteroidota bacterium]|nr:hypothetical protein [Bacteroidota bacterium]
MTILMQLTAIPQITSIGGEFRYQQQYQTSKSGNNTSKFNRYSPQFNLGVNGYLYSPRLISYGLQTAVHLNYNNSYYQNFSQKSKSFLFNYYNINATALQNYLVRLDMFARDGELESSTNIVGFGESPFNFRQQQQRLQISTEKIYFLPTTNIYYNQNRSWSVVPTSNADQIQREFGINLSKASTESNISLSGNFNDVYEKSTGDRDNYYRLVMNGMKQYTEKARFDINTEYYSYNNFGFTSGSLMFYNEASDQIRLGTSVNGRHIESENSVSFGLSLSQSVQYLMNKNLHLNYNIFTTRNDDRYIIENNKDDVRKIILQRMGNAFNLQHMFGFTNIDFSNGINVGYSKQAGTEKQSNINGGFANSINARVYDFNITSSFAFNKSKVYYNRERDETFKNASLAISKLLFGNLNSESMIDYRDEDIYSKYEPSRSLTQLRLNQRFITSLYYYIPFSLSFNGNINWNLGRFKSKFYSINLNFNSAQFFMRNLSLGYSLSWSYDPMTRRDFINQDAEINYQWRALSFQLRLREFRFIDKRRELWFTVARPF